MSDKISSTLQNYYDKIFQDGKLINIHIGMWGMSYNLTEADIKLDVKLPSTIKLGKKMLIKTEVYNKFKTAEQKLRVYLYSNSFDFPLVGQAHFVPKTKFVEVYTHLSRLKDEYMAMVDEFVENYEGYKREALEYYEQNKDILNIQNLENSYPAAEHVRSKFYVDIVAYEIALPTSFNEINLQDEIDREARTAEAQQQAEAKYSSEYSRQLQTHMSKVEKFMEEATATLRTSVVEFCGVALTKIEKSEVVSESNIQKLLEKVQEFRSMNFLNDHAVDEKLTQLEKYITGGKDFKKDSEAINTLQQYLKETVVEAQNMTDLANVSGEYFRKMRV
jgi:hypothetical protein